MLAVALVGGSAVVGVALARGAWDQGAYAAADPCTTTPDPYPVGGLDGFAQNAALGALNGAACELGVSREELVLSIDPDSGFADVQWDDATAERAIRSGLVRSIDDLEERGSIPGPVSFVLKELAERAPVDWVLDQLGIALPG